MSRILSQLFGISPAEATFARRGFESHDERTRCRLEQIGMTFLQGYHLALAAATPEMLGAQLNEVESERRGFAFEGAAMALTLLDGALPQRVFSSRRRRLPSYLSGCAKAHIYMAHVGVGWAMARLPVGMNHLFSRLDPLLRWLAIDGYGFHAGYFDWRRAIVQQQRPAHLNRYANGYAAHVFDQGLGRSLWFVKCAQVSAIAATIDDFAPTRRADLWSGAGLACAYAGGVDCSAIAAVRERAGPYLPQVAQGVAFAVTARRRAGNPAEHTDDACAILCGVEPEQAARITDEALEGLTITALPLITPSALPPAYEIWRRRIQAQFD